MTIAIVTMVAMMGFAIGHGRKDVVLHVGGYIMAAVAITILLIFACVVGYTQFIHYLWNLQ